MKRNIALIVLSLTMLCIVLAGTGCVKQDPGTDAPGIDKASSAGKNGKINNPDYVKPS